jgi:DNA end-binding protein Ku
LERNVEVPELDDEVDDAGSSARAFWSGVLSFGLVSIPIELVAATRRGVPGMRLLTHEGHGVVRKFWCPVEEHIVEAEHLVRGFETESGEYVAVSDEELEALDPEKSREIDLQLFVAQGAVSPLFFDRSYFLLPSTEAGKAYALLAHTLESEEQVGIASFVLRDRQHWVAILASGGVLRAQTLRFREQVRSVEDINLPKPLRAQPNAVKRFTKLLSKARVERLPTADLEDDHGVALAKLAASKAHHKTERVHVQAQGPAEGADVIDLMQVLKERMAAAGFKVQQGSVAPSGQTKTSKEDKPVALPVGERRQAKRATKAVKKRKPAASAAAKRPRRAKTTARAGAGQRKKRSA